MRLTSLLLLLLSVNVPAASGQTQQGTTQDGESLYAERCAKCHESGVPRAANREALRRLAPDAIRLALTTGSMRTQGAELTPAQIDTLARLLGATALDKPSASGDNACPASPASSFANALDRPRWNGWGANLSQHRFQPADVARLPADQVPRLKLKWAFGFPGVNRAFAQPTVVGGRVFVGSATGIVYSLNAGSGCQVPGRSRPTLPCVRRLRSGRAAGPRRENGLPTSVTRARRCTPSTRSLESYCGNAASMSSSEPSLQAPRHWPMARSTWRPRPARK